MTLHVLDLCTGYAGLSLGLSIALAGRCRCVGYVEREGYAAANLIARIEDKVLDDAPVWDDLKTFDGFPFRGKVDCITAGYPCQPFSYAGLQRGTDDPRHLWPDVRRIIEEVRPGLVFLENVANHLNLGYDLVCASLQSLGYRAQEGLFEAAEIGSPHYRRRLFVLAYTEDIGYQRLRETRGWWDGSSDQCRFLGDAEGHNQRRNATSDEATQKQVGRQCGALADTDGVRKQQPQDGEEQGRGRVEDRRNPLADTGSGGCRTRGPYSGAGAQQLSTLGSHQGMADGDGAGLAQRSCFGCDDEPQQSPVERDRLPLHPPWYDDLETWESIWHDVVTASLEPAIHGMADGPAHRADRLRLCGNGVHPLVAAHAFGLLARTILLNEKGIEP